MKKLQTNRWIICITAVLAALSLAIDQNKIEPILNSIMSNFHVSESAAGLTSSIFTVIGILVAIPASAIMHKFTIRKTAITCLVLALVGSFIGVFTNNFAILLTSRVIEGIGVRVIAVAIPTLIALWFKPKERGLPMAIWVSWMTTAQTVIFLSAPHLVKDFGWRSMWWFAITVLIIGLILDFLFVRTPEDLRLKGFKVTNDNETISNKNVPKYNLIAGLKSKDTWILSLAGGFFSICSFTFVNWIAIVWHKNVGLPLSSIEPLIAVVYFLEIFYTLGVGYLLKFVKNRKLLIQIGLIIYGILGLICFNFTFNYYQILALIVIFPIFDGGVITSIWTLAPSTNKSYFTSQTMGVLNVGLNTGIFLAAPFSGWLLQFNPSNLGIMFIISSYISLIIISFVKAKN